MINSKNKGKKGELEIAKILNEYGYECRRSVQYNGKDGEADVVGLPYIHIEVKRVEHLNIENALNQAKRDVKNNEIPAVFHRTNRTKWKVTLDLEDFMKIYNEYYSSILLYENINKRRENI